MLCLPIGSIAQTTNGLVLLFSFPSAPVNNVIVDGSGAGNNGQDVNGSATWVASDAGHTNLMSFDGAIPSEIIVPTNAVLNSSTGAITFWMRSSNVLATPNPYAMIFDRRGSSGGDVIYQAPNGHLACQTQMSGTGVNGFTTVANPTDGNWHHVAYVYDQSAVGSIAIYIDGVQDTRQTNSGAWQWAPSEEIEIGASHASFWAGYTGELNDFRIYNRVLSGSEVAQLAGLGTQPQIVIPLSGQPQGAIVGVGDTLATLSVTATVINGNTNQSLAYQWRVNGTNIAGATNATFAPNLTATNLSSEAFACVLAYPGATNVTSASATFIAVPDLVLRFSFLSSPTNNIVTDSSGAGNDGTDVNGNATWVASDAGRTNLMSFDGTLPSEIIVPTNVDFQAIRGTIAFWMRSSNVLTTPNQYAMVFDHRAMPPDGFPTSGGDVIYQGPSGQLACQTAIAGRAAANGFTTAGDPTDGKWHHVAYVYDQTASGFIAIYVDGVQDTRRANTAAWYWVPQEELEIGASHDAFWTGFEGELSDFRIYTRDLSGSEIGQLAGLGPQPQIVIPASGQPQGGVVGAGDTAVSLTVNATVINGNTNQHLAYQWRAGGTSIPGATNATYFPNLSATNIAGAALTCVLSYPGATNVTSASATFVVVPDLVLRFGFAAAPTNNVIVDSSGAGNNGTNVNGNATWVASDAGRTNIMSFDGTLPSEIIVPTNQDFQAIRGTIAFWMKSSTVLTTPNQYAMVFDHRAMPPDGLPTSGGDVIYQAPSGQLACQTEIAGRASANAFTTVNNPTDGNWHHVAYVYDQTASGFIAFYIDGVQDTRGANKTSWYWVPQEELEIGASHDTFWTGFEGEMSDFRIYTRDLPASEIAQLAGLAVPVQLGFSASGGKLTLSWSQTGFVLQQNLNLTNSQGWTNVVGGSNSPVVITIGQGAAFYRLKKP